MGKFWTFAFVITGIMVLFYLAGFNTNIGGVIGKLGLTSSSGVSAIRTTPIWTKSWAIITSIVLGGGILIGIATKSSPAYYFKAAFAYVVLGIFLSDLIAISNILSEKSIWISGIGLLLVAPIIVGYIFAAFEWLWS